MKTKHLYLAFISIIFIVISCEDFFETDLSQLEIDLLSPSDNFKTQEKDITLWWDYLYGAYEYQLQAVSPGFSTPDRLILDTIITNNRYIILLDTGVYQWRVRGLNTGSATDYSVRNLSIIESQSQQ